MAWRGRECVDTDTIAKMLNCPQKRAVMPQIVRGVEIGDPAADSKPTLNAAEGTIWRRTQTARTMQGRVRAVGALWDVGGLPGQCCA